jgi:hypothetical protein
MVKDTYALWNWKTDHRYFVSYGLWYKLGICDSVDFPYHPKGYETVCEPLTYNRCVRDGGERKNSLRLIYAVVVVV